jgi:UMF1 family MFS transporter
MGLLQRLALHRRELRAWALYDVANSAMFVVIVTGVFPVFFKNVSGLDALEAERRFGWATTLGLLVVALLAPILGAVADFKGRRKRFLLAFGGLGVICVAAMFWISAGQWLLAAVLFALANIGASGSIVFYDSLLPHVAREEELDRLSTTGFALGYLGSGLFFLVLILWIQAPERFGLPQGASLWGDPETIPIRSGFVAVALWWALFSIPILRRVSEPPRLVESDERAADRGARVAFRRLGETFRELRRYRQAFLLLLAFLLYNDGIGTIIRMATIFGSRIGIELSDLMLAVLVVQFVGVPCAFAFGKLAGHIGAKRSVLIGLAIYVGIALLGLRMTNRTHFYALAVLVGMVQGGTQALSRSLFASMIPRHKSAEFFGLFAVLEKFAGLLGPVLFVEVNRRTASGRGGMLVVLAFFVVGGFLLQKVDVEAGRREARAAGRDLREAQSP